MELTAEQIAANEATALAEQQAAELKATSKKDALRDLSKELGINAFEPTELKAKFDEYNKWKADQTTDLEKLQGEIDSYKAKETEWQSKELGFNSKLQASTLGIPADKLDDALKLAGGDPTKLGEVIKKYPVFVSKEGIKIGVTTPNQNKNPDGLTEQELYMAQNPKLYGKYGQK
jgi:hypothetical protein